MKWNRSKTAAVNVIDRLSDNKTKCAYVLMILLGIAVLIRFTPIIRIFWINWVSAFIVKNWLWITIISILLFILGKIEVVIFERKLEEERRKNK